MVKRILSEFAINFLGRSLKNNYVLFESDDWGAIRMSSKEAYNYFKNNGYGVENCPFNRYDILETREDIEDLAEILGSAFDYLGNPAKFTLNHIVGNPDFIRIRESGFEQYYYETTDKTYHRLDRSDVLKKIKEGVAKEVFEVQFHGREHLNVNQWMSAMKKQDKLARKAFDFEMFSLHNRLRSNCRTEYLEAFGGADTRSLKDYKKIIREGKVIFKSIWGKNPESFIAPCYMWPSQLEDILYEQSIKHIQTAFVQKSPQYHVNKNFKKVRHYQGEVNKKGQTFTVRNVLFEPSINNSQNWVQTAMRQIEKAFNNNKPAIISSHRLNYVGGLDPYNKSKNLIKLKELLVSINKHFPDVKFITSSDLYSLYNR